MMSSRPLRCIFFALIVFPASQSGLPHRGKQPTYRMTLRGISLEDCGKKAYSTLHKAYGMILPIGDVWNVNFTITKTIQSARESRVVLHRCQEYVSENTCEYFSTWSFTTGLCSLMVMPNMLWTPMIKSITPPLKCPVKKGFYSARNATLDINHPMMRTAAGGYVWKASFTIFDQDNQEAMCVRLVAQAIKHRVKS